MEVMAEEKQDTSHSRIKLYFSVFILNLVYFACGCAFSWSSPTLPKLMSNHTDLNNVQITINNDEASWIVSTLSLGNMLGPITAGFLLNVIGRRWTTFVDVICFLSAWLIISQKYSVYLICIGRFFIGVSIGISFSALPLYIAEISEDSVRGALNNLMQVFVSFAVLLTYSIGPFITYNQLIIFGCTPCVLFLIFFPWLPESPYYLISRKKNNVAFSTLQWLRSGLTDTNIEREIKVIQANISESEVRKSSFKDLFLHPGTRKAFFITSILLIFQQLTGISIVIFYAEPIFKMTGTAISSSLCAILVGAVMLFTGCFGPFVVAKFGYKTPLLVSAVGITVAHAVLGVYLALFIRKFEIVHNLNWIPVIAINTFIMFHVIGFSTVPWTLTGEFFSPDMKTIGAAADTFICAVFTFALANLFPNLAALLGIDVVFLLFCLFSIIAIWFVIYYVPNTSKMSLAEIQELFNDSRNECNNFKK